MRILNALLWRILLNSFENLYFFLVNIFNLGFSLTCSIIIVDFKDIVMSFIMKRKTMWWIISFLLRFPCMVWVLDVTCYCKLKFTWSDIRGEIIYLGHLNLGKRNQQSVFNSKLAFSSTQRNFYYIKLQTSPALSWQFLES